MRFLKALAVMLTVMAAGAGAAFAQAPALPLPEYGVTPDVAGAANRPDPALTYKLVFDITRAAPGFDTKNPGLVGLARYINTLAQHGVAPDHRQIAVVLHGPATDVIMTDAAYATRTGAKANPNTQLIRDLKAAGVDLHVCGQAARGRNISREMAVPEVIRDLSGNISLINFQVRGYVLVGE